MWDIVWVLPQGHGSVSVSRHFLLQALQCPCSVRKWFSETTVAEGGRNPVGGLWGHTLGENWPPEPTSSYASTLWNIRDITDYRWNFNFCVYYWAALAAKVDQRLGIRCRLTSVIRRVVTSLSDIHWKHSCLLSTMSSALEVFLRRCAI